MVALLVLAALPLPALGGPKTDTIVLRNGNQITCEIKGMERGRIRVSTDSMGTIYIEWDDVVSVSSPAQFVVELYDGRRARGELVATPEERQVMVRYRSRERILALGDIVWIDPLKVDGSIKTRWDGSLSLGIDVAKTDSERNFNGEFDARHRDEKYILEFSGSAVLRSRDEASDTTRAVFDGIYRRLLDNRYFWAAFGGLERNDELGMDLRSLAGAGGGRFFSQTTRSLWLGTAGLVVVNEQRAGDESAQNSLEMLLNTNYEFFTYDTPKTSVNLRLTVFPSLTDWGRVRSNLNFYVRRELIEDLFLQLSTYYSLDNEPPDEGETSDYGITFSIGYTF
jgi:hypothetical protein